MAAPEQAQAALVSVLPAYEHAAAAFSHMQTAPKQARAALSSARVARKSACCTCLNMGRVSNVLATRISKLFEALHGNSTKICVIYHFVCLINFCMVFPRLPPPSRNKTANSSGTAKVSATESPAAAAAVTVADGAPCLTCTHTHTL